MGKSTNQITIFNSKLFDLFVYQRVNHRWVTPMTMEIPYWNPKWASRIRPSDPEMGPTTSVILRPGGRKKVIVLMLICDMILGKCSYFTNQL